MAGRTTRSERLALAILVFAATTNAATPPFVARLYPVLDNAGCKSCHHAEGVASGTRLRFPAEGASMEVVEAFGNSLVDLVDRANPKRSLLLNKPTNRVKHTGGERIKKGSAEERLLRAQFGILFLSGRTPKFFALWDRRHRRSRGYLSKAMSTPSGGIGAKIVFAGVGKTDGELRYGLESNVTLFNVESEAEHADRPYRDAVCSPPICRQLEGRCFGRRQMSHRMPPSI